MYFVFGCIWDSSITCVCVETFFHVLTFAFFCWTRLSRSKSSSIVKANNSFEEEKLKVEQVTGRFEK